MASSGKRKTFIYRTSFLPNARSRIITTLDQLSGSRAAMKFACASENSRLHSRYACSCSGFTCSTSLNVRICGPTVGALSENVSSIDIGAADARASAAAA